MSWSHCSDQSQFITASSNRHWNGSVLSNNPPPRPPCLLCPTFSHPFLFCFPSSVLVSRWKRNQRDESEGSKLSLYSFFFLEEAKNGGEEMRNWWAEEVRDWVSNEGNLGSDSWLKPLPPELWHPPYIAIGPSAAVGLWRSPPLADVSCKANSRVHQRL